jgi:hypothetical protein
MQLRVFGQHHLKSSIKDEAIHNVRPHAPANPIGGLDNVNAVPCAMEMRRTRQTCQSRSDNDNITGGGRGHYPQKLLAEACFMCCSGGNP